ncbi:MAG: hypothetical protein WC783_00195 [Candidatus Paceibacterota bacterium]|jgi:hypothetical protein
MHANYLFLVNTTDFEWTSEAVNNYFQEAYAIDFCDENNWYQPAIIVNKKNEVLQLVKENDWRGRDEYYTEIMKLDNRYEHVLDLAWSIIIYELSHYGNDNLEAIKNRLILPYDIKQFQRELTTKFAEVFEKTANVVKGLEKEDYTGQMLYNSSCIIKFYEAYSKDLVVPPFTNYMHTPDDEVRTMRLCDEKANPDNHGIIVVDIHT